MITGDVGVTTLKLSFIGVCLMGDLVGIGRAHDCPILTVETEHLSNIMDKDEKTATPEVEKIHETLPKALRTQALTALTSEVGLVGLVW